MQSSFHSSSLKPIFEDFSLLTNILSEKGHKAPCLNLFQVKVGSWDGGGRGRKEREKEGQHEKNCIFELHN